ncbi:hypothetical protein [Aliarcobacter butzleri]|uniref:hypothetical protein n=1 Tax=Aliarcobacter butzleri TaxID=28197 RepID=UPI0021B1D01C|nr:hypothetical protein [Aliarcobacter butzleri]MCT7593187.1 hypothetical protein [Aliarcobacter butzleri]MCT7633068.1 hypothetical protein [Aliarcobacter butzleri]
MNIEYPMWDSVRKIMNNKNSIYYNFITLGDSRTKAGFKPNLFNFKNDVFEINSINLSLGGSTPIEGYYTLYNYLLKNEKPQYLLLSYGPIHLMEQDCFWTRNVRFDFLEYNQLRDIINLSEIIEVDNKTIGNKEKIIDYKINTSKYFIEFSKGIYNQNWILNKEISDYLQTTNGQFLFGKNNYSSELNRETTKKNFVPAKILDYYFEKLLKLSKDNNIKVYYYTMPFNESSFYSINKDFKIQYDNYINSLSSKYQIEVLNKLNYLSNDNFGDSNHLHHGVDMVTLEIKEKFINSFNEEWKLNHGFENIRNFIDTKTIIKVPELKIRLENEIFDIKKDKYLKNNQLEILINPDNIELKTLGTDPTIQLNHTKADTKNVVMYYEINSSQDTVFQLFYKKEKELNYNESDSYAVSLSKGNNKVKLLIPSEYLNNTLRIDLVSNVGNFEIKELKIFKEEEIKNK